MFSAIKRTLGIGNKAPPNSAALCSQESKREFAEELMTYAENAIGGESALSMLDGIGDFVIFFKTPESAGLPNRGRTWEALIDSETGAFHKIIVFLDVEPIDKIVKDFFHDAMPVIERIKIRNST